MPSSAKHWRRTADWLLPQIDDAYQAGTMPSLLPGTRPALGDGGS